MKLQVWAVAVMSLFAGSALAQTTFADIDTDGSGELSYQETVVAIPDLSEADFAAADADQSGGLSIDEVSALAARRQ